VSLFAALAVGVLIGAFVASVGWVLWIWRATE
jgi:hypothetical protein